MKRAVLVVATLVAGANAAAALADTVTQQPLPWQSPPFNAFGARLATGDPTLSGNGNMYAVATGPGPSYYVVAYNIIDDKPLASVGGGTGYVGVTLPFGASIDGLFIQGTNAVLYGRVSQGTFVQSYSLKDGSSPGPIILTEPVGTSFTATGGTSAPGAGGATNIVIDGSDTIGHTPMLFTGTVTNGTVSTSPLCPSYFNSLTSSSPFAPSAVGVNGSGQMLLAGVQIGGLTQLPAVGAVNAGCTALTVSPLAQPGGATNDGFADAISALPDGSFVSASDVSLLNGSSLLFNRLQAIGSAVPGSSPLQGRMVSNVAVTNVFPLGSGFAGVGTESVSGSPSQGALYRFDASGNLVGGAPTLFGDSNHADTVLQFAQPFNAGVAIGGLGSPLSGTNTLDLFKATTTESPPPPCTPVVLSVTKTISVFLTIGDKELHFSLPIDHGAKALVLPGSVIQYVIRVTNTGNCDATNVEISDLLPHGFSFGNVHFRIDNQFGSTVATPTQPQPPTDGTLRAPASLLQPHQQAILIITGDVNSPGELDNIASVGADGGVSEDSQLTVVDVRNPPPRVEHFHLGLNDSRAIFPISKGPHTEPVAHVDVAVEKDGKNHTCQWLNGKEQLRVVAGGCAPLWLAAKNGANSWSYRFKKPLSPGSYRILVRPIERDGAAPTQFAFKDHDLFRFRIPKKKT